GRQAIQQQLPGLPLEISRGGKRLHLAQAPGRLGVMSIFLQALAATIGEVRLFFGRKACRGCVFPPRFLRFGVEGPLFEVRGQALQALDLDLLGGAVAAGGRGVSALPQEEERQGGKSQEKRQDLKEAEATSCPGRFGK